MAHTKAYTTILQNDRYYHIFNRSVGNDLLFRIDENYEFFLKKYRHYLDEAVETISFCLLPNHFHFFVRIIDDHQALKNFKKLFQSYSLAFNRRYSRRGTLLERPYKRVEVLSNEHITRLIRYIHQNPQKHGLINDFRTWKWSSFKAAFDETERGIISNFQKEWFLSEHEFISYHMEIETKSNFE